MTGIIVQARLGSTRLPQKMVKPFYGGKGVFELITEKIIKYFPELIVIVATTKNPLDDELENLCKKLGVTCYRGSENNVLERFIQTAEKHKLSKIVRVCADNPFLNIQALKGLIEVGNKSKADYISYKTSQNKPTILTHYGFWAEIVRLTALKKVQQLTSDKLYLEHVTNFIYKNPDIFTLELLPIPKEIESYSNVRMTLDTKEDFDLLQEIYQSNPDFNGPTQELINLVAENTNWLNRMKSQILKNEK